MTCIVGISHQGRVLLGGDSAATSYEDKEIHSVGNQKVFNIGPYAVGFAGSFRLGNILQYQTELPEPPEDEGQFDKFFTSEIVSALRRSFEAASWPVEMLAPCSIMVGLRGRLFVYAGVDMFVAWRREPYAAVGAGRHVAYGVLHALQDHALPAKEKAERALEAAQKFVPGVLAPFTFVEA